MWEISDYLYNISSRPSAISLVAAVSCQDLGPVWASTNFQAGMLYVCAATNRKSFFSAAAACASESMAEERDACAPVSRALEHFSMWADGTSTRFEAKRSIDIAKAQQIIIIDANTKETYGKAILILDYLKVMMGRNFSWRIVDQFSSQTSSFLIRKKRGLTTVAYLERSNFVSTILCDAIRRAVPIPPIIDLSKPRGHAARHPAKP